jgi:hypothetical protein
MQEQHFDFVVSGLSEDACDELLAVIQHFVEEAGGTIGGGYAPVEEAEDGQDTNS